MQHRRRLKSAILDRHWFDFPPVSLRHQSSRERASTPIQELDLPLGPMGFHSTQLILGASTRLEQLQSVFRCGDLLQPLY